jgi:hypothetical protein
MTQSCADSFVNAAGSDGSTSIQMNTEYRKTRTKNTESVFKSPKHQCDLLTSDKNFSVDDKELKSVHKVCTKNIKK